MKELLPISDPNQLSLLYQRGLLDRRLLVLAAAYAGSETMLNLAAQLALRGPLRVLDGGNRFNAYTVARAVRRLSSGDLAQTLKRIQVARAFTCHQVLALLEETQALALPTLVIDLLDTFYDESVALEERRRLAIHSVANLRRLCQRSTVVVSLRPPRPPDEDPTGLLDIIREAADQFWFQDVPDYEPAPTLF